MEKLFNQQIGFVKSNWVDLILVAIVIYYLSTNKGFIQSLLEILGFFFALLLSYKSYSFLGKILVGNFFIPIGFANAIGFFIGWFLAEIIFYLLTLVFIWPSIKDLQKHRANILFGYLISFLQAAVIYLLFISLVFTLPLRGSIKRDILESKTGPFFINASQSIEKGIKNIFGEAISETINFLTIKPDSSESLDLRFRLPNKKLSLDKQSEEIMLSQINNERAHVNVKALILDEKLREVARAYAEEMFSNGFFSHISQIDGSSVAERASRREIEFYIIGENLAFAPDVYLAHQGLMNSEGHRKNILFQDFSRVGIGVVDGGFYGKMFVQVFAD